VKKIYVGNLPFSASEEKIQKVFSQFGTVHSVKLLTDPVTGRIRGFGFIEMEADAADEAIKALDGTPFEYRKLRVHEAFERVTGPQSEARTKAPQKTLRPRPDHNGTVLTVGGRRAAAAAAATPSHWGFSRPDLRNSSSNRRRITH